MRRRPTAVPRKYEPPSGLRRGPVGSAQQPSNPTGRLVLVEGSSITHWCPDANETGEYSWKCPSCGSWFHWSVDKQEWRVSDGQ
jgi:hypothetical protein